MRLSSLFNHASLRLNTRINQAKSLTEPRPRVWHFGFSVLLSLVMMVGLGPISPASAMSLYPISGTVTDAHGDPLPGISLEADGADGSIRTGTSPSASDGSYSLMVPPGDYTVIFQDDSYTYVPGCYATDGFTANANACSTVTISAGGVSGINVTLPLAQHISGTVYGPDGTTPLADVGPINVQVNYPNWFGTRTRPDGTYTLAVLPGVYALGFNDDTATYVGGFYDSNSPGNYFTVDQNAGTPVDVTTADASEINVAMPRGVTISGTVYEPDGSTPLANINVNAYNPTFGNGTQTDNNGDYAIAVLPNAAYTMWFHDNTGTYVDGCYASSGFTADWNACTPVTVADSGVASINVVMLRGVTIRGTVYGPDGTTPLANIDVNANAGSLGFGAQTDHDGNYSMMVSPNASYTMWFHDSTGTHVDGCYTSSGFAADWNACTPVDVTTADVPNINVAMPLGVVISGAVYGPDGTTPLANINVGANLGNFGFGTQTDNNGNYTIAVLPNATYTLQFNDNSGAYVSGCYSSSISPGHFTTDQQNGCTPVEVTTSNVSLADVSIPLGVTISGTVYGPDGLTPLANINVNANNSTFGNGTNTDNNGVYSIAVLPNAAYIVSFNDNSGTYVSGCYDSNSAFDHFTTDQQNGCTPVEVVASNVPLLDVTMPRGVTISGTVYGPDGTTPLADIWANASGADNFNAGYNTGSDGTYLIAVLPGDYTLQFHDNTGTGTHLDGCYASEAPGHFTTDQQNGCTPVTVTLSNAGPYDVLMPLGVTISGTVYGSDGLTPLANINVNANADNSGFGTNTDNNGNYSFAVLPNTAYTVSFNDNGGAYVNGCYASGAPGHFTTDQQNGCTPVDVAASNVSLFDVTMPLGVTISGTVYGPDGPLENINVNANSSTFGAGTNTDNNGNYSIAVLLNATYTVSFNDNNGTYLNGCYASGAPGHFTTDQQKGCTPVDVTASNIPLPDVTMSRGVTISGTVYGPDGPLANINVNANNSTFSNGTNTDNNGNYSLVVSPNATYTLQFNDNSGSHLNGCYASGAPGHFTIDQQNGCTPVDVTISNVGSINVTMPRGVHISGTVYGPDGPLANINVNANAGDSGFGVQTDNNGNYSVTVLSNTVYTLQFYDNSGSHLNGCYASSASGHFTADWNACTPVTVTTSNVDSINVTMPQGLRISGTVYGPDGLTPLTHVWVNAWGTGNFNAGDNTDNNGNYSITVPSGDYRLQFHDNTGLYVNGCYLSSAPGHFTPDQGTCTSVTVTTADVGHYDVSMPSGHRISGNVSGPSGPLTNISVNANGLGNSNIGAQTDSNGDYSITVLPGDYTISFHDNSGNYVNGCYLSSTPGHFTTDQSTCTSVTASTSDVGSINVTMPHGLRISGRITGPDGQPLTNANANTGNGVWANTDGNGNYSLVVLPGDYTIWFHDFSSAHPDGCYSSSAPGHFTAGQQNGCTPVTVTTADVGSINVTMSLGHHISGTVYGPDGLTPLANINVNANAGNAGFGAQTDNHGNYSITVPSGAYTLQFHDNSGIHVDGCYASSGFTTDWNGCTPVDVSTSDASGINVAMPLKGVTTHFAVSVVNPYEAGTLHSVTVTALDAAGNIATGYLGTVSLTSSDLEATLPDAHTFSAADGGVYEFPATLILKTVGSQTVIATDNSLTGSITVTVTPAPTPTPPTVVARCDLSGRVWMVTLASGEANYVMDISPYSDFSSFWPTTMGPNDNLVAAYWSSLYVRWESDINSVGHADWDCPVQGVATHFAVQVVNPYEAGMPHTVTVTALDALGNIVTGYTGTVSLSSSDPRAALPGSYTFSAVDAGVHKFPAAAGLTLKTAGPQTVIATDLAITGSTTVTVVPAAAKTLVVTGLSSPRAAGTPGTVTVTVKDAYGNIATGYLGTVGFSSSDPGATLPDSYAFSAADAGVHTFNVTLVTPGNKQSVTATDTAKASITGSQKNIVVQAVAIHFAVAVANPYEAGMPHTVTVTALDAAGNIATGYTGTVSLGSSDPRAALPASHTFSAADAGVYKFPAGFTTGLILKTAGLQTVTATDSDNSLTGNLTVTVTPSAAKTLVVSGLSSPRAAGAPGTVTVIAKDAYGNIAIGYLGTVGFSSSDPGATLPDSYTFSATDAGVHIFNVTLVTPGKQTVTVTDAVKASITGSQKNIVVQGVATHFAVQVVNPYEAGMPHTVTVTALDALGNIVTGYTGTVSLSSSDPRAALPGSYTFSAVDAGVHKFPAAAGLTLKTAGPQTVIATDLAITGSTTVTVVPAAAKTLVVTGLSSPRAAGTPGTVTVTVKDAYGNIATGYLGTVGFSSSDPGATLPDSYAFSAADAGVHTFNVTLVTPGNKQSVTATDTAKASITGSQKNIVVQ